MKIGIFYASKTGTTCKCAHELANYFCDVDVFDLSKSKYNLNNYNLIIIGSSVRMGRVHKKVKKFIKKNHNKLLNKKIAYFLCNAFKDKSEDIIKMNIDEDLINRAIYFNSFGGEIDISKQRGFDKIIINMIMKNQDFKFPYIDYQSINSFAKKIIEIGLR